MARNKWLRLQAEHDLDLEKPQSSTTIYAVTLGPPIIVVQEGKWPCKGNKSWGKQKFPAEPRLWKEDLRNFNSVPNCPRTEWMSTLSAASKHGTFNRKQLTPTDVLQILLSNQNFPTKTPPQKKKKKSLPETAKHQSPPFHLNINESTTSDSGASKACSMKMKVSLATTSPQTPCSSPQSHASEKKLLLCYSIYVHYKLYALLKEFDV